MEPPPQLESAVVHSTTCDHQRSREQPLLPYDSTFYPSHFATNSASHYSLTRGQPSLLQSAAKLYDPGLSTRPVYASYSGCNLNSEKSGPPAQLTSSAPSVSVATQTEPVSVTSANPMDETHVASESRLTPTAPAMSVSNVSYELGNYVELGQRSAKDPVLPFSRAATLRSAIKQNQWSDSLRDQSEITASTLVTVVLTVSQSVVAAPAPLLHPLGDATPHSTTSSERINANGFNPITVQPSKVGSSIGLTDKLTKTGFPVRQLLQKADDESLDYWDEGLFVAVGFKLQTSGPYDGGGVDKAKDSMIEIV